MPPNFQILLINSFAISAKSYVYTGGEVHFKRQCHSSRVAACIEATVKGEPAELLHMYFAMELPHQHELQANLLARAQSLEMATVVARQFQRFLGRPVFCLKAFSEECRGHVENRWNTLGGPPSRPHRWIAHLLAGSSGEMQADFSAFSVAVAEHYAGGSESTVADPWNFLMLTKSR